MVTINLGHSPWWIGTTKWSKKLFPVTLHFLMSFIFGNHKRKAFFLNMKGMHCWHRINTESLDKNYLTLNEMTLKALWIVLYIKLNWSKMFEHVFWRGDESIFLTFDLVFWICCKKKNERDSWTINHQSLDIMWSTTSSFLGVKINVFFLKEELLKHFSLNHQLIIKLCLTLVLISPNELGPNSFPINLWTCLWFCRTNLGTFHTETANWQDF